MGHSHFQVSDRVRSQEPVFLYKWVAGELHQYFPGERVPAGLVARFVGPVFQRGSDWLTYELEVESSTHSGLQPGDRFIVQNLDSVRWAKISSVLA